MAYLNPNSVITWEASPSAEPVTYKVYYSVDGTFVYGVTPAVDVSGILYLTLPSPGIVAVPGVEFSYAVTAVDESGNESDFLPVVSNLDSTAPEAPTDAVHTRLFSPV